MSKEFVEISMPKFVVPLVLLIVVGLIAFFVFSNGDEKQEVKQDDKASSDFDVSLQIDVNEGAYLGDLENAKYAIVEFSDYQCGFCGRHAKETLPEIEEKLLGEGSEVVYFFREVAMYPPKSMTLSIFGQCIFENEGMEKYRDFRSSAYNLVFDDEKDLYEDFDATQEVIDCLEAKEYEDRIESHWTLSQEIGMQGVPGFLVGKFSEDGKIDGFLISGAYPFSEFEEKLELLKN